MGPASGASRQAAPASFMTMAHTRWTEPEGRWPEPGLDGPDRAAPALGSWAVPVAVGQRYRHQIGRPNRRRRVPLQIKWAAGLLLAALIFRRAIASVVLMALSAALHLVGVNMHLPSVKFGWPWQAIGTGSSTNTDLGPWILQKIEGISRPALGQANFSFVFTHKVSKSIGIWPCWYSSTFYAEVGHASATVET